MSHGKSCSWSSSVIHARSAVASVRLRKEEVVVYKHGISAGAAAGAVVGRSRGGGAAARAAVSSWICSCFPKYVTMVE